MSYSTIKVNLTSMGCNDTGIEDTFDFDSDDIVKHVKNSSPLADIIKILSPNQEGSCLKQVVITEEFPDGYFMPLKFAYVSYHHAGDPSRFEVIGMLYEYMKKLGNIDEVIHD